MPPRPVLALAAFVVVLAACGDEGPAAAPTAAPSTVAPSTAGPTTTLSTTTAPSAAPQRIVSLSPSLTEMLYAVGAGDQVVAVDKYSDFPAGAPVSNAACVASAKPASAVAP